MKKLFTLLLITIGILVNAQSTLDSYTNSARFLSNDFLQTYQGARIAVPTMTLPNSLTTYTSTNPFQNNDILQVYNAIRGIGDAVTTGSANYWSVNGNSVTAGLLGTTSNQPFSFITNNTNRGGFGAAGEFSTRGSNTFGTISGSGIHNFYTGTASSASISIQSLPTAPSYAAIFLGSKTPSPLNYDIASVGTDLFLNAASGNLIYFNNNNNTKFAVGSAGAAVTGSLSVSSQMSVSSTATVASLITTSSSATSSLASLILDNTFGSGWGSTIFFRGSNGGIYDYGSIQSENHSTGGLLRFQTADAAKVLQTRMTLNNAGNLGINKSAAQTTATLDVTGTMSVSSTATVAGAVRIGTAAFQGNELEVANTTNGGVEEVIRNASSGASAYSQLMTRGDGTQQLKMTTYSSGFTPSGLILQNSTSLLTGGTSVANLVIGHQSIAKDIIFVNGSLSSEAMRVSTNNCLGINKASPTATLDVTGTFSASSTSSLNGLQLASGSISVTAKTINTTAGDAATINSPTGRFRKDTSGSTFVLTNSFVTANSIIIATFASDPGMVGTHNFWVTAGTGEFTLTFDNTPTSNADINFLIIN